jgi:hypothetical protein
MAHLKRWRIVQLGYLVLHSFHNPAIAVTRIHAPHPSGAVQDSAIIGASVIHTLRLN